MIYPHTVTIFIRLGEEGRRETWKTKVLTDVRIEERSGAYRHIGGDLSADASLVLISSMDDYVEPSVFTGDGEDGIWTLREHDKMVKGATDVQTPPPGAWSVQAVETVFIDGGSIHHLEVYAQ